MTGVQTCALPISAKSGYATRDNLTAPWKVEWIAPAGYMENGIYIPYTVKSINDLPSGQKENTPFTTLPETISAVQIVSTMAYIAHISIFDLYGNFVRSSIQVFGGMGELQNQARVVPKGLVSYLIWDMKDAKGQQAGQGVYVWKVQFEFKGGKQEVQYTKTGVLRKN